MDTQNVGAQYEGATSLLSAIWCTTETLHFIGSLENKIFKNHLVNTVNDAVNLALEQSKQGVNAYFAMSGFMSHESRLASNTVGASSFWVDIDCGQEKANRGTGYLTKGEANSALIKFCKDAGLPQPTHLVDSGNGIHAYWALTSLIPTTEWQAIARKLKVLTVKHGLIADPTRTADIASVLRVPCTYNYKDKSNKKLVKLKYAKPNINAEQFICLINADTQTYDAETQKLGNELSTSSTKSIDSYHYESNKDDFYSALCAAYPIPTLREDWRSGVCALAYLIVTMGWPELEVIKIREGWENLAFDADKTDNENQWQDALKRTADRVKSGEQTVTHLSILKKARANGWQPKVRITDALTAAQNKFALISLGGKVGIVDKQELDVTNSDGTAARLVVMSRIDGGLLLHRFLAKYHPQVDSGKTLAEFMRSKDTALFNGVEFNPRGTSPDVLNLWVGATATPKQGNCSLINDLLLEVLCGGRQSEYQYLIKYLAHALQRPWEKPGVMVVLLGGQGIGKGTLAKILQRMWSATFLQTNRIKQIVGDFNGSLERAYIVFLDEALFVGDRNSSDALKSLVTEPSISINEKHQPTRQIKSYHRFFSATNADHFKATDRDDRRDFVLRVSEHRKGDHAFWDALNAEIENGGIEAFAHELLAINLTGFNVRAKPNTRELTEQKIQSLDKFPRWWFDCLSQGVIVNSTGNEWPSFISSETLRNSYFEGERAVRTYKSLIDRDVVNAMSKMCSSAKREQGKEGAHRKRGFTLPLLDAARADFEKFIGDKIEWDDL